MLGRTCRDGVDELLLLVPLVIWPHGLTDEARELSREIVEVATHALPVTASIGIYLISTTAIARIFPTTPGRFRRCWCTTTLP